jgi:crossover junction endodeoxyribonuclease RuvC
LLRAAALHNEGVGVTAQQFEQMQNRLNRRTRPASAATSAPPPVTRSAPEIILGIDPSLRGTGYGIIRSGKPSPQIIAQGTIACPPGWERSRCLAKIFQGISDVIRQHRPTVCVVEGLFYAQNLRTALIMGEARGAALAAGAGAGLEIYEIATRKVKQAIVGYGAAQKLAVAKMVQRMLGLRALPAPDAADALALALTHAQERSRYGLGAPKQI